MNKGVIVVIGIAIAIAIIAGVYAVSVPQDETPSGELEMKDEVDVSIQPPGETTSSEQEEFGIKDKADVTINPPEEGPPSIEQTVREGVGLKSGQGN